ncbi:hypothetical protein Tco_1108778 [Tanacetum coccineum]
MRTCTPIRLSSGDLTPNLPARGATLNTIELPVGTVDISFDLTHPVGAKWMLIHDFGPGEDLNKHLKDVLKLVAPLTLTVWLNKWDGNACGEDLYTSFLAHFFPPGTTTPKFRNDIPDYSNTIMERNLLSEAYGLIFKEPIKKCPSAWHRPLAQNTRYCMEDLGASLLNDTFPCVTDEAGGALPSDMVKNPKLSTLLVLVAVLSQQWTRYCSTMSMV